jgi:hypothetical protein
VKEILADEGRDLTAELNLCCHILVDNMLVDIAIPSDPINKGFAKIFPTNNFLSLCFKSFDTNRLIGSVIFECQDFYQHRLLKSFSQVINLLPLHPAIGQTEREASNPEDTMQTKTQRSSGPTDQVLEASYFTPLHQVRAKLDIIILDEREFRMSSLLYESVRKLEKNGKMMGSQIQLSELTVTHDEALRRISPPKQTETQTETRSELLITRGLADRRADLLENLKAIELEVVNLSYEVSKSKKTRSITDSLLDRIRGFRFQFDEFVQYVQPQLNTCDASKFQNRASLHESAKPAQALQFDYGTKVFVLFQW